MRICPFDNYIISHNDKYCNSLRLYKWITFYNYYHLQLINLPVSTAIALR